jgi:hypothetical protein
MRPAWEDRQSGPSFAPPPIEMLLSAFFHRHSSTSRVYMGGSI